MLTIHDKRNTSKDFFIQTLFHMIYIKEKTTGLILRKKNEKPVMFIKNQVFFLLTEILQSTEIRYRILILIIIQVINISFGTTI